MGGVQAEVPYSCQRNQEVNWLMPGFHHSVAVLPLPFRRCKIPLFCKKFLKKIPFCYSHKHPKRYAAATVYGNGNG